MQRHSLSLYGSIFTSLQKCSRETGAGWMKEWMRKQLKTWKISTGRYNSNGLGQRLACEVRRFGPVAPRFVVLSLGGGGVVAVKQGSTSGRCGWLQILHSSPNINSTQCLSCNWKARLFWKLALPSQRPLPACKVLRKELGNRIRWETYKWNLWYGMLCKQRSKAPLDRIFYSQTCADIVEWVGTDWKQICSSRREVCLVWRSCGLLGHPKNTCHGGLRG